MIEVKLSRWLMRDYYYWKWYYSDIKIRFLLDILIVFWWNVYDC